MPSPSPTPPSPAPRRSATSLPGSVHTGYYRIRRFLPIMFFVCGFLWDALTLTRIDNLIDNLIFLAYLAILGGLLLLTTRFTVNAPVPRVFLRFSRYTPWAMQFLFGSLFSGYVVNYFKSMTLAGSAFFFIVLVALLITNEYLESRMTNVYMTLALYFFCVFAFLAFFIPVATGYMNRFVFVLAGLLSLAVIAGLTRYIWPVLIECSTAHVVRLMAPSAGIWLLMTVLYFANLLPPVPLSMKEGGIYRGVERQGNTFVLTYEKPVPWHFWRHTTDKFHYKQGDTAYCFSAVFAPRRLQKRIYHHWKFYGKGGWTSAGKVGFGITGGRDAGYRGYTFKSNLTPGRWRVDVETEEGQIMGRISFDVVEGEAGPVEVLTR